jgi:glycerol kinase
MISETTALGAAMLAGLAIGTYKSTDDLSRIWKASQSFKPNMSAEIRNSLLSRWKMAIEAVMVFKVTDHE